MALTCGFFNSLSGDRKYNAEDMGAMFDGVINNGIFQSIGNQLRTIPGTGLQVIVQSGKAWLSHTWVINDENYPLTIDPPDALPRYDTVVLEVNHDASQRAAYLYILKGTPSQSPAPAATWPPTSYPIAAFPLAYVWVGPGATSFDTTNIAINVGGAAAPFVTGLMQVQSISELYNSWYQDYLYYRTNWQNTFDTNLASWQSQFNTWFSHMQIVLSEQVVASLQAQITANATTLSNLQTTTANTYLRIDSKATPEEVTAKANNAKYVTPYSLTNLAVNKIVIGGATYTIVDAVEG